MLDHRPPDLAGQLANTAASLRRSQAALADARQEAGHWATTVESSGGLRGLTPAVRARRNNAQTRHGDAERFVTACQGQVSDQAARLDRIQAAQAEGERFARANAWRQMTSPS